MKKQKSLNERIVSAFNARNILCSKCHTILSINESGMCPCCQTVSCNKCLQDGENYYCDLCKKPFETPYPLPNDIINELQELKFNCKNRESGCLTVLPYLSVDQHEKDCVHREFECPDCHLKLLYKNFKEHFLICAEVYIQCNNCYLKAARSKFSHYCQEEIIKSDLRPLQLKLKINVLKELCQMITQEYKNLTLDDSYKNMIYETIEYTEKWKKNLLGE